MIFPAARFRKSVGKPDVIGLSQRSDLFRHPFLQFFFQSVRRFDTVFQTHEGGNCLALDFVRPANDRGFGNFFVRYQRRLHFHRAQPMTGHVQNVVHSAHNPEIAVFILARTVARKVGAAGNLRPVLLHITVGIAVDCPQHGGPRLADDEIATRTQSHGLALHGYDLWNYTEERASG
jgi:hypothetical protein